jgi:hypothetical protein
MHEELNNFKRNKVWTLVEKPKDCRKCHRNQVGVQEQTRHQWGCCEEQGSLGCSRILSS